VNIFGGDKTDRARHGFSRPALDLPIPGSLSVGVSFPLKGLEEFLCKTGAILGWQGSGAI
jgi:hypothetical protein